ncbi:MAG TPA: HEAT repeat domain-containing protein [Vicinamibacterales bacterium]|nr:HEAT repeat domain-containing protein [Vicinamibacterales bacterium]
MTAPSVDSIGRRTLFRRGARPVCLMAVLWVVLPAVALDGQAPVATLQQLTLDVGSPDAKVRRAALRALRERGGPEALVLLAHLVGDPDLGIREGAIEVVIGLYVQPPAKRSMANAEDAFLLAPYRTTPYPPPTELTSALVKALADEYPSVRRDSAYAVGIVMRPPATSQAAFELTASLSDREPAVRKAAAQVLGRLGVLSAGVPLIGRINDEVLDVRLAAMRAVGELRDDRAVPALTDQFAFYVRGVAGRTAIDALARIGSIQSRSLFESQIESGYPAHRQSAYEGLARMGGASAMLPRLMTALTAEKDRRVRLAIEFALTSAGRPAVDGMIAALADRSLADQALEYLVELGQAHTTAIASGLGDRDPVVREQLAIALGFIGGQEATAALASAASDESADVRAAVSVAQLRLRQGSAHRAGS